MHPGRGCRYSTGDFPIGFVLVLDLAHEAIVVDDDDSSDKDESNSEDGAG
jgi:hypothetical protein